MFLLKLIIYEKGKLAASSSGQQYPTKSESALVLLMLIYSLTLLKKNTKTKIPQFCPGLLISFMQNEIQ